MSFGGAEVLMGPARFDPESPAQVGSWVRVNSGQFDPDIARLFLADLQTRGGHC